MKNHQFLFGLITLLLFVGLTHQGRAQSNISVQIGGDGLKSASKARSIALSNTLSPIGLGLGSVALFENNTIQTVGSALTVYGLVVGPSTGNFYAEDYKRGAFGMLVRATGAFLMVDATREIFGNDFADALKIDDKKVSLTDTKILIGEVLVLGSIAYNILTTGASVEEYNSSRASLGFRLDSRRINDKVAPVLTATYRF